MMDLIANLSFWQIVLCIFGSWCFICLGARLLTLTIAGAYFEKKKEYVAFVASAAATAFTKYQKEMNKNN